MFRMLKTKRGGTKSIGWFRYELFSWVWGILANGFESLNPTILRGGFGQAETGLHTVLVSFRKQAFSPNSSSERPFPQGRQWGALLILSPRLGLPEANPGMENHLTEVKDFYSPTGRKWEAREKKMSPTQERGPALGSFLKSQLPACLFQCPAMFGVQVWRQSWAFHTPHLTSQVGQPRKTNPQ